MKRDGPVRYALFINVFCVLFLCTVPFTVSSNGVDFHGMHATRSNCVCFSIAHYCSAKMCETLLK